MTTRGRSSFFADRTLRRATWYRTTAGVAALATLFAPVAPALAAGSAPTKSTPRSAPPPSADVSTMVQTRMLPVAATSSISGDPWRLFDNEPRSLQTIVPSALRLSLSERQPLAGVTVFGSGGGTLTVSVPKGGKAEPVAGLTNLSLGPTPGWHRFLADQPVSADGLVLDWAGENQVGEVEIWGLAPRLAAETDVDVIGQLHVGLPRGAVEATAEEGEIAVGADVAAGGQAFHVSLQAEPRAFARAFLVYELSGLPHWTAAARKINEWPLAGGHEPRAGQGGLQVEEINPAWLNAGQNSIRFEAVGGANRDVVPYTVKHLRVVGLGRTGAPLRDQGVHKPELRALSDADPSTGVKANDKLEQTIEVPFGGPAQALDLSFHVADALGGNLVVESVGGQDSVPVPTALMQSGWHTVRLDGQLPVGEGVRLRWQRTGSSESRGTISEVDVTASPVGGQGRGLVVTYPRAGECAGASPVVRGFVEPMPLDPFRTTVGGPGIKGRTTLPADGAFTLRPAPQPSVGTWAQKIDLGDSTGPLANGQAVFDSACDAKAPMAKDGTREDVGAPFGQLVKPTEAATLVFGGATIEIPKGAVDKPTRITMRPLPAGQVAQLNPGMQSVTPGEMAYRFGPHGTKFQKPIKITLPVEEHAIGPGLHPVDVRTFFFDEGTGRWKPIARVAIAKDGKLSSVSDHFTDFLNATLPNPEHPTPDSFGPKTIADLKAASPMAGIQLIEPPSAGPDGAAHLSFPIEVPPGRHGIQPQLAVTYNNQGGDGLLGMGWDLKISSIEVDTRFGVPEYLGTESERYLLDGDQLVPATGHELGSSRTGTVQFYRRREGRFDKIERIVGTSLPGNSPPDTSNYYWVVTDKSGTKFTYGKAESLNGQNKESRAFDPAGPGTAKIAKWFLEKVEDTFGNKMHIFWTREVGSFTDTPQAKHIGWQANYPEHIDYTEGAGISSFYRVSFAMNPSELLSEREDVTSSARTGFLIRMPRRLDHIEVRGNDPIGVIRTIQFAYDDINPQTRLHKSLLKSITVKGPSTTGDTFQHTFEYQRASLGTGRVSTGIDPVGCLDAFTDETTAGTSGVPAGFSNLSTEKERLLIDPSFLAGLPVPSFQGHGAVGFGISPLPVCDLVHASVGGGLNWGGQSEESGYLDVDGDGIPDFLGTGAAVRGKRDLSFKPSAPLSADLGKSITAGFDLQVGAHLGFDLFSASLSRGWNWNWTQSTLADMDGDGLVDLVKDDGDDGLKVRYNLTRNGVVGFGPTTAVCRIPTTANTDAVTDMLNSTSKIAPILAWTAPYAGTVKIGGPVQRVTTSAKPEDDIMVGIYLGDPAPSDHATPPVITPPAAPLEQEWLHTFQETDSAPCAVGTGGCLGVGATVPLSVHVEQGQRLYFVTTALGPNTRLSSVDWRPIVQFTNFDGCGGSCPVDSTNSSLKDPTGAYLYRFSPFTAAGAAGVGEPQVSDFRLTGRQALHWTAPHAGNVRITGGINSAGLGDDTKLVARLKYHSSGALISDAPLELVSIPSTVFSPPISSSYEVNFPAIPMPPPDNTVVRVNPGDQITFQAISDTPIDPDRLNWRPRIQYRSVCRGSSPEICCPVSCIGDTCSPDFSSCSDFPLKDLTPPQGNTLVAYPSPYLAVDGAGLNVESYLENGGWSSRTLPGTGEPSGFVASSQAISTIVVPAGKTGTVSIVATFNGGSSGFAGAVRAVIQGVRHDGSTQFFDEEVVSFGGSGSVNLPPIDATAGDQFFLGFYAANSTDADRVNIVSASAVFDENGPLSAPPQVIWIPGATVYWPRHDPFPLAGGAHGWYMGAFVENDTCPFAASGCFTEDAMRPPDAERQTIPVRQLVPIEDTSALSFSPLPRPTVTSRHFWLPGSDMFMAATTMSPGRIGSARSTTTPGIEEIQDQAGAMSIRSGESVSTVGSVSEPPISTSLTGATSRGTTDFLDLNGDGYPDGVNGGTAYINNGNGCFEPRFFHGGTAVRSTVSNTETFGWEFGGLLGVTVPTSGLFGEGNDTRLSAPGIRGAYGLSATTDDLVDINGDGLPDRLVQVGADLRVQYNLGGGLSTQLVNVAQSGTFPSIGVSQRSSVGVDTGFKYSDNAMAGVGDGASSAIFPIAISGGRTIKKTRTLVDFIDVSGDGLLDQVMKKAGEEVLRVRVNQGGKLGPEELWCMPRWSTDVDGGLGQYSVNEFLVPGEHGSNDVLSFEDGANIDAGLGLHLGIPVAVIPTPPTLTTLCLDIEASSTVPLPAQMSGGMRMTDVDGDGFADHLLFSSTAGTSAVHAKLNKLNGTNLLTKVTNPLGGTITLGYTHVSNVVDYTGLEKVDMPHFKWNLYSVTVDNKYDSTPNLTTFSYGTSFYDRLEREDYGFNRVTVTRPDLSTVETTFLNQQYDSYGHLTKSLEKDAAGNIFGKTTIEYQEARTVAGTSKFIPEKYRRVCFYEGTTSSEDDPCPLETIQESDFDNEGNMTLHVENEGTAAESRYNITPYVETSTHIEKPGTITLRDSGGTLLRERIASYAPTTGFLTSLQMTIKGGYSPSGTPRTGSCTPASACNAIWTYTPDTHGNIANAAFPAEAGSPAYTVSYTYDPDLETFVDTLTDAFGYTARHFVDTRFGETKEIHDVNGYVTKFGRDELGRLTRVWGPVESPAAPDGTATVAFEYFPTATPYPNAVTHHLDVAQSPGGDIRTATFTDGIGRIVQTKKDAERIGGMVGAHMPTFAVSGRPTFDLRGRVVSQGQPFFKDDALTAYVADAPVRPTMTDFDVLGRPTKVRVPDPSQTATAGYAVTNITYGFGSVLGAVTRRTTTTDPKGSMRWVDADVRGLTAGVTLRNMVDGTTSDFLTTYTYDAAGLVTDVLDAGNNHVSATYDTAGQMLTLTSPDMGRTDYRYDLAGKLGAKQTANLHLGNQWITYAYTKGRIDSIDYPSTVKSPDVLYEYGGSSEVGGTINVAGRIKRRLDDSGQTKFEYDSLGEVKTTIFTPIRLDSAFYCDPLDPNNGCTPGHPQLPTYTTRFEYDSLNRLLNLTYPDDEKVNYEYDAGGMVKKVWGQKEGRPDNVYVKDLAYDAFGAKVRLQYSDTGHITNGHETDWTYDPNRRWLTDILTSKSSLVLQAESFGHDAIGNISDHTALHSHREHYDYDNINQLTHADGDHHPYGDTAHSWHYDLDFAYDGISRMKSKTQGDVRDGVTNAATSYGGTYNYSATAQVHTPDTISRSDGTSSAYYYDGNGNRIGYSENPAARAMVHQLTWDDQDRLLTMTQGLGRAGDLIQSPLVVEAVNPASNNTTSLMTGASITGSPLAGNYLVLASALYSSTNTDPTLDRQTEVELTLDGDVQSRSKASPSGGLKPTPIVFGTDRETAGMRVATLTGTGIGTPQLLTSSPNSTASQASCVADFDLDGLPDVMFAGNSLRKVQWFRRTGPGPTDFDLANPHDIDAYTPLGDPRPAACFDFDNDGDIDVVMSFAGSTDFGNSDKIMLYAYRNAGEGASFTRIQINSGQPMSTTDALAGKTAADFNGDGKPDLAVFTVRTSGNAATNITIYTNTGNAQAPFDSSHKIDVGNTSGLMLSSGTPRWGALAAGDYNADGKMDLWAVGMQYKLYFFKGNGDGTFQYPVLEMSMGGFTMKYHTMSSMDLDGDNKLDFILASGYSSDSDRIRWWRGTGGGAVDISAPVQTINSFGSNIATPSATTVAESTNTGWIQFASQQIVNFPNQVSHTLALQYRSTDPAATASIRDARISVIPVTSVSTSGQALESSFSTPSGNYVSVTSVNASTPTGKFLLLATADVTSSGVGAASVRLSGPGGQDYGEERYTPQNPSAAPGMWRSFAMMRLLDGSGGTQTFSIDIRAVGGGTASIKNARVTVIPVASFGTDGVPAYSEAEGEIRTSSTTLVDRATTTSTTSVTRDYLILGSALLGNESSTADTFGRIELDGTPLDETTFRLSSSNDRLPVFLGRKVQLGAGTHTAVIRYRTGTGSSTREAIISNARILMLPLAGSTSSTCSSSTCIDGMTQSTGFVYNADGTRTHKREGLTPGSWQTETIYISQYAVLDPAPNRFTKHIYVGDVRVASIVGPWDPAPDETDDATAVYFFHTDQLQGTKSMTDGAGTEVQHNEYFATGELWTEEVGHVVPAGNWMFTGKEFDAETGLYYFGARYYDPRLSVWVNPDPILKEYLSGAPNGGVFDPYHLALYNYVSNNPIGFTDPLGLDKWTKLQLQRAAESVLRVNGIPNPTTAELVSMMAEIDPTWSAAREVHRAENKEAAYALATNLILMLVNPFAAAEGGGLLAPSIKGGTVGAEAAAGAGVTVLDSSKILFSQSSVRGVDAIAASMKANGWVGGAVDVVKVEGRLITLDNTRVLAAHMTGTPVQAVIHGAGETLPASMAGRFVSRTGVEATTWGEAVMTRIGNQSAAYRKAYPAGSSVTGVP